VFELKFNLEKIHLHCKVCEDCFEVNLILKAYKHFSLIWALLICFTIKLLENACKKYFLNLY